MTTLTAEDLQYLTDSDIAAFHAREQWIRNARAHGRAGKQIPPVDEPWNQFIWKAGRGFGKLVAHDTKIPVPSGWSTMGSIAVGDLVFDERGGVCRVTAKYSPPIEQAYRLSFSDGTWIDADAGHQWVTWTHRDRKQYVRRHGTPVFPEDWPVWRAAPRNRGRMAVGPEVRTTQQIVDSLLIGPRRDPNHSIPLAAPLVLPDILLPLEPWCLGYWLGNGTTGTQSVTAGSLGTEFDGDFVGNKYREAGFECAVRAPRNGSQRVDVRGLNNCLSAAGVLHQKHIPAIYLRSSVSQRLALLRGLMDSDGHPGSRAAEFCSTNKDMAFAALELIRSLGEKPSLYEGEARLYGRYYSQKYRVLWSAARNNPFSLPRKAAKAVVDASFRNQQRMIWDATPIPSIPMSCITVDSPNSMYLVGEGMIPTHNTMSEVQWLWWECFRCPGIIGHAVGPTIFDMKGTLFEGPAGLLATIPKEILKGGSPDIAYDISDHEIMFANGSKIRGFGATDGGSKLRGPQAHCGIGDELREWDKPAGKLAEAHSNMMFGIRLPYPDGTPARAVFGTTPKAIPYLLNLYRQPGVKVVTGTSYENLHNLSRSYADQLMAMKGTKIGRAEIDAEDISDEEGAIFQRSWIRMWPPFKKLPEFSFILVSLDTAMTDRDYDAKKQEADYTACGVWGVFNVQQCFPLEADRRRFGVRSKYAALCCDFWMEQVGFPELLERVRKTYRTKYGPADRGRRPDVILIEHKQSGISLRQSLMQYGIPTWPFRPGRQDKTMRAHAASPWVNQGMLWVPETQVEGRKGQARDWVQPMLDQVCSFAGEGSIPHDDAVDSTVQMILYLADKGYFLVSPHKTPYPDPDELVEKREREAVQIHEEEKRGRYSPYGT